MPIQPFPPSTHASIAGAHPRRSERDACAKDLSRLAVSPGEADVFSHVPARSVARGDNANLMAAATPKPAAPLAGGASSAIPACFKIGFEALDIDAATIRSTLAQGRPFAADVDAKMREILGVPLRAGGVEALFTKAWPTAVWVASYEEVTDAFDMPRFTLSALDRLGKVIFDVTIGFTRDVDGAIDMHAAGADVDREHRGFGITAYAELMREKILQAYSTHSQARLSLQASNAVNANTGAKQAASGFYLHALRGYMFADSQNVPSLPYPRDTPDGEADRDLSQVALLAKYFKRWAQNQQPSLSDFDCTALAAVCAQPYDYTQMAVAGQSVGRAYLLSGAAPAWNGVHFVNPPAQVTAADAAARARHRSKQVWDHQLGQEIASARQRILALRQSLWEQVSSADDTQRGEAYVAIGMLGHPDVIDFLSARLTKERHPQVQAALQEAIARVRGEKVNAGLQKAAEDPQRSAVVREEMQQRLLARTAA